MARPSEGQEGFWPSRPSERGGFGDPSLAARTVAQAGFISDCSVTVPGACPAASPEPAEPGSDLSRQVLAFCDKQVMRPQDMDLNEVIQASRPSLRKTLGDAATLELDLAVDLPPVQADPAMIDTILGQLVANARDAMPRQGRLVLRTSPEDVDEQNRRRHRDARPGHFVCLSVQDTGCGMDPATLRMIFEPFFTTKNLGQGAGLGLATVYGMVKQHNGWIEVTSQPGQGTHFKIYFPAMINPPSASLQPNLSTAAEASPKRVLIVEDEDGLQMMIQTILEGEGYAVFTAGNATDALRVWEDQRGQIDLLLTDVMLADGMSGRELAERLQSKEARLKVILSSGYAASQIGDKITNLREGVNFIQKPYRPQMLLQVVKACLTA